MHQITINENKEKSISKYATTNTKDMKVQKPKAQIKNHDEKTKKNYFKFFAHVMFMGKGLFEGKKVISIQLSKNNMLQGMATNSLICLVILNNTKHQLIKQ
jgi:hypothetical protein